MMTMLVRSSAIRLRLHASKYRCLTRWKQSREREKAGGARDPMPMPSGFHVVDLSPFSKAFALRPWLDSGRITFLPRGQVPCQLSKFFEKGENSRNSKSLWMERLRDKICDESICRFIGT